MTGIAQRNFPLFDAVSLAARAQGWDVLSPAEQDRAVLKGVLGKTPEDVEGFALNGGDIEGLLGMSYEEFLGGDFIEVIMRDAIILIPGWEDSPGAKSERFVAEVTGKDVYLAIFRPSGWNFYLDPQQKRMNCVLMARRVDGELGDIAPLAQRFYGSAA